MTLNNFIEGLLILRPYYNDGDGYQLGADHDIVYVYSTDRPLSAEDITKMTELGWFQPDSHKPESEGFSAEYYNHEEGWAAYT